MMTPQTFALAHLLIIVAVLVVVGIAERRGRKTFYRRHRGVRYRHLSTSDVMKRIRSRE